MDDLISLVNCYSLFFNYLLNRFRILVKLFPELLLDLSYCSEFLFRVV